MHGDRTCLRVEGVASAAPVAALSFMRTEADSVAVALVTVEGAFGELSDDALVALVAARDGRAQAALEALYGRYCGAVHGLGLRILGDAGQAEHLVQETFLRLWRSAETYEPHRVRLGTWLLRLARNKAISELRAAACRPKAATPRPGDGDVGGAGDDGGAETMDLGADVPELVWEGERRRLIRAALLALPAAQREAVELAYFQGLTHREIAAAQAAPASTIKTRLALGLRKMAQQLQSRGVHADTY